MKTKYAIIIALLVLAIIGYVTASIIVFNHSDKTAKSTDTDKETNDDAKFLTWWNSSQNKKASFEQILIHKTADSKASFIPMWKTISNEKASFFPMFKHFNESGIIKFDLIWSAKQSLPALLAINFKQ